jgi:hypothetical protein
MDSNHLQTKCFDPGWSLLLLVPLLLLLLLLLLLNLLSSKYIFLRAVIANTRFFAINIPYDLLDMIYNMLYNLQSVGPLFSRVLHASSQQFLLFYLLAVATYILSYLKIGFTKGLHKNIPVLFHYC